MISRRLSAIEVTPVIAVLAGITALKLLLHLIVNAINPLGYFRDEFYYIASAQHLDWGYVDHPPLIAVITRVLLWIPGDSLLELRFLPALAGAATVLLTGLMARRLGAGTWGVAIAALAILIPPVLLATNDFLSTIAFYDLFWVLCCYLLLRLVQSGDERLWIAIGATLGLGLMTKHNIALLMLAVALGVLLTPLREHLRRRWLWLGVLLATVIVLPHLIWQMANGWPVLEFAANASTEKSVYLAPHEFLLEYMLAMSPVTLPVWICGIVFLLRPYDRNYRLLGYTFLFPFLFLLAIGSNDVDYLAPAYAVLMAAGAVAIERWATSHAAWIRQAAVALLAVGGLFMLPATLPVLPTSDLADFTQTMGLAEKEIEQGKSAPLPQWWADRFGWESLVADVAGVYDSLPEADRSQAVILTSNYGEAGALELLGSDRELPPVVSGHNTYYLWGPGGASGNVVIAVGFSQNRLEESWSDVETGAIHKCQYCMDYENDMPIYVARGPLAPLATIWSDFKHYE